MEGVNGTAAAQRERGMTSHFEAVQRLLYLEARLLDEGRLDEWLDLFTPNAVYWIPAGDYNIDPNDHVSIVYDTRQDMERRVARLKSGYAYAEDPPSRTHRAVSNLEIQVPGADGERTLTALTVMSLFALTKHKYVIHSARCEFLLQYNEPSWKIERKKVGLLRNDEPLEAMPYLI
jgi:benzoate/toluate 1,2-dioxygenase beta subunit